MLSLNKTWSPALECRKCRRHKKKKRQKRKRYREKERETEERQKGDHRKCRKKSKFPERIVKRSRWGDKTGCTIDKKKDSINILIEKASLWDFHFNIHCFLSHSFLGFVFLSHFFFTSLFAFFFFYLCIWNFFLNVFLQIFFFFPSLRNRWIYLKYFSLSHFLYAFW